jgi:uncharacterized protein YaaW (UPF0174 family)
VQGSVEEKLVQLNVKVQWNNIKKCVLDIVSDFLVVKVERKARKLWIAQQMINKMDEQRKWKKVSNEEGKKNYIRLRNKLKRSTDKTRKGCLESMEFQRIGCLV